MAVALADSSTARPPCHCEERSDEATSRGKAHGRFVHLHDRDRFVAPRLAMTFHRGNARPTGRGC
jgi:hypothetical protein